MTLRGQQLAAQEQQPWNPAARVDTSIPGHITGQLQPGPTADEPVPTDQCGLWKANRQYSNSFLCSSRSFQTVAGACHCNAAADTLPGLTRPAVGGGRCPPAGLVALLRADILSRHRIHTDPLRWYSRYIPSTRSRLVSVSDRGSSYFS